MANEPGSTTSLEWIELYNSGGPVSLESISLRIGGSVISLPSDIELAQGEYYIVCRRLYATETSPGFESSWGDSSGVWGDTPYESRIQTPFEAVMSLTNDTGCVELLGGGTVIGSFTWNRSGLDGYSWERVAPDDDSTCQSIDPSGSTPGFINSVTPAAYDLALTDVTVQSDKGVTVLAVQVKNVGLMVTDPSFLSLINTGQTPSDTIDIIQLDICAPGDSIGIEREYTFDGLYLSMMASLAADDRDRNNTIEFTCVGQEYPPLVLSEFLANPTGGLSGEWVEIKNRSNHTVDPSDWRIGDLLRVNSICDESILIESGGYIVVAQDSAAFLDYYHDFNGVCLEPGSWASLNNDADCPRLVDGFGIEADRFEYDMLYGDNYTWCRTEEPLAVSRWGRSSAGGGTPGEANEVVLQHQSSQVSVTLDPPYISPDGDGFEDFTTITVEAPLTDSYTVKIYDRQGRVVRSFYDEASMIPSEIEWNGLSDSGRRLPIGLYIVYVEASGIESVKKTIVVAR